MPAFPSPTLRATAAFCLAPTTRSLFPTARARTQPLQGARAVRAKHHLTIFTVGKRTSKDRAFDDPVAEYAKRMSHTVSIAESYVTRPNAASAVRAAADRGAEVFLLDAAGTLPDGSEHLAALVFDALDRGGSRLSFVIGDADGLPGDVRALAQSPALRHRVRTLSLSTLTFTHKMIRLVLYEQLYRATEIRANTKYHK